MFIYIDLLKKLIALFFCLLASHLLAQTPDSIRSIALQGITVTAYNEEAFKETSLNVIPLQIDSLTRYGNYNLTDLLAQTPGVSMLTTGVAIAKPVVRGLYGNRLLVLLSGLKFDNQQWQEEHGLGLSDLGLSKVELIKGPMSVLYGTEAIGGIINLIEEEKPTYRQQQTDISLKLNSNTLGGLLQAGYKANYGKQWFRIRVGIENNADYTDGNNTRVLNSRFDGYYLKSTWGFYRKNWSSVNNFSSSFNRFGFIFNDIYNFVLPDDRWSRRLNVNPAHLVLLNIFSSENKIILKNTDKLSLNIGIQSNERLENEGGGAISLNMHLLTCQYLLKWTKELSDKHRLIVSNLGSFENNTNFGARKIVPDANMQEANLSVYYETNINDQLVLENGVGVGEKWITTFLTPTVNSPEKEIQPFSKLSPYYNLFSGISIMPNTRLNLKLNISTGVRVANLAELSSNGLHEGIFTYEIGSPLLKNEQNLSFNLLANYKTPKFEVSVSPFYNHFFNYIYLSPTTEQWFGFPVYRYRQQDAMQYGTELSLSIEPAQNLQFGVNYSGMISKTHDDNYTPFTPAQKISPNVGYQFSSKNGNIARVFANADYCFAQNNTAPNEIATPSYWLLNIGGNGSIVTKKAIYDLSLAANNLLNTAYYDHLSRFKYFGLLNIGRNIVATLKVTLVSALKQK